MVSQTSALPAAHSPPMPRAATKRKIKRCHQLWAKHESPVKQAYVSTVYVSVRDRPSRSPMRPKNAPPIAHPTRNTAWMSVALDIGLVREVRVLGQLARADGDEFSPPRAARRMQLGPHVQKPIKPIERPAEPRGDQGLGLVAIEAQRHGGQSSRAGSVSHRKFVATCTASRRLCGSARRPEGRWAPPPRRRSRTPASRSEGKPHRSRSRRTVSVNDTTAAGGKRQEYVNRLFESWAEHAGIIGSRRI